MKITTEKQRNVKLLHLLNEKVICLTLTEKKNTILRQNWTRLGARVYEKITLGFRMYLGTVNT